MILARLPRPVWSPDDESGSPRPLSNTTLRVLAREVIDRLSLVADTLPKTLSSIDIDGFCIALIEPEPHEAKLILLRAHENGLSHGELCTQYLAVAARHLGMWWDHDVIAFREMTVAAGRLLTFLRDLRDVLPPAPERVGDDALFATVPNEQHTLGIMIATEVLRSKGCRIDVQLGRSEAEISRIAAIGGYPIVGLSASGTNRLPELTRTIVDLRVAAPRARIVIGGHIVDMEPDIAELTGADAAAVDIETCLKVIKQLSGKLKVVTT